jgi:CHAT domain-containing protein/lipoprotein NlpI
MRRRALTLVVVLTLTTISVAVFAATITVPDDYLTIQAAIDAAQLGDTVYVRAGVYKENLVIDKPLSIIGEDRTTTTIRSLYSDQDVIHVMLTDGTVHLANIKASYGNRGVYVHAEAGAQVTLNDAIVSENQTGIALFGEGDVVVSGSYVVDNNSIGILLGNATAFLDSNEIIRGETGLLLVGSIKARMDNNQVCYSVWGIDTHTTGCGFSTGDTRFRGAIYGEGNKVTPVSGTCPSYPAAPWPEGFLQVQWGATIHAAGEADNRGLDLFDLRDYEGAIVEFVKGLSLLKGTPFPLLQAYLNQDLGNAYLSLGESALALEAYQSALNVYIARGMDYEIRSVSTNLVSIGDYYAHIHEHETALAIYLSTLSSYQESMMPAEVAGLYLKTGSILDWCGYYQDALTQYEIALAIYIGLEMEAEIAACYNSIGIVHTKHGHYDAALSSYKAALAICEPLEMKIFVARIWENIGVVNWHLGRYEEALAIYATVFTTYKENGQEVDVAGVCANMGIVFGSLGRYDEALASYAIALSIFEAIAGLEVEAAKIYVSRGAIYDQFGLYEDALTAYELARRMYAEEEQHINLANVNVNIGIVYAEIGHYKLALDFFESACAVYSEQVIEANLSLVRANIGRLYMELERYDDALSNYISALNILDQTPPLPEMRYSYPAARWVIQDNAGIAHEAVEDWDKARVAYEDSIAVIESIRGGLASEELKLAWQGQTVDVYERLIDLLYRMGEGSSAFMYAERCRARSFLDLLAKGPVGTIENVAEEGIKTGGVRATAIEQDVNEVISTLPEDTAALVYFVTDTATYVWVIYEGEIQGPIQLEHGRAELMHKVICTREQLGGPEQTYNPRNLIELYDWLIRPVEHLLPKTTGDGDVPHLIIIPSGPLYYLPFQALLWTSQDRRKNASLITRYALSYSPSLATLKYAQALSNTAYPDASFLGLADPDSGDPTIPRLPDAQKEARVVAELFPVHSVYVDRRATEDVVQSQSSTAREILLSTHGLFNPHNPMYSYLLVSPTMENDDGKLYAHEVFSLPLHANMVVLSACETLLPSFEDMKGQLKAIRGTDDNTPIELTDEQLEQLTAGDEVVGLTRAFISAGASSVLSSLWSVPSGSTSQLMISFYKHIQDDGMDRAHALREAQLEVMSTLTCTHPYYWAAFNLMGDWR